MIDFAYIALSSTLVPVLRVRGHYGYTDLKNQAFLVLSFLHLVACLALPDGRLPVPGPGWAASAFFMYLAFITISCAWSDNAEDSIRDLPRWWTLFYFFLVCGRAPALLALEAVFLPSCFVAAYGLVQQWFRLEPFWKDLREHQRAWAKRERLYSWLGNSNYTAAYLTPCFFIGLFLSIESSLWWITGLVPVWLAIGFSRCRAAWVATVVGLVVLNFMLADATARALYLVGGAIGFVVLCLIAIQRIESTIGRVYYIRTCLRLLREKPLFGWGPRVFRRMYFEIQARMNAKDPTILGTPKVPGKNSFPIGKRAHGDHFETLAESGLFGYLLFAAFYALVLWRAADPILACGIVAGLVNALFFYNLRTGPTALPFFALAGVLAPAGPAGISLPPLLGICIALILGRAVYQFSWVPFRAGLLFHAAQGAKTRGKAVELMRQALALDPNNNMFLAFHAIVRVPDDPVEGLLATLRTIHHDDGQKVAWSMWEQAGKMAFLNNALHLSRECFRRAHRLNPASLPACEGLRETERCISVIEAEFRRQQQQTRRTA